MWASRTVGKGEIDCYKQFLLFPQCFQNSCTADMKNQGLFLKGLRYGKNFYCFLGLHGYTVEKEEFPD